MTDSHHMLDMGWGPIVRGAVVARVEYAYVGRRGTLVRTLAAPDDARYAWTEELHQAIVAAVYAETGADLDELGSQAAWARYDEVWEALRSNWEAGGTCVAVSDQDADAVAQIVGRLPTGIAEAAGADIASVPSRPLTVDGVMHIDREGIYAYLARSTDLSPDVLRDVQLLLGSVA